MQFLPSARVYLLLLALPLLFTACRGPEGDPGPPGPPGPQGPAGPTEPTDIYVLRLVADSWSETGTFGEEGYGWIETWDNIPEIDQMVLDSSVVLCYEVSDNGLHTPLPYVIPFNGYVRSVIFAYQLGSCQVEIYDSDFQAAQPSTLEFKFVIVDEVGFEKTGIDYNDYQAVARHYNLAEAPELVYRASEQ